MVIFTVYNPETGAILWNGSALDEDTLPAIPSEYAGYQFALGIKGDPETERLVVLGDGQYELEPCVPIRDRSELINAIIAERSRRLAVGFDYDFGDERGVHRIGTTDEDMRLWREVNDVAFKAVARGQGNKQISITTDTGPVVVTADEWLNVLDTAEEFRQPLYTASFVLQSMQTIPQNVEDPEHWT